MVRHGGVLLGLVAVVLAGQSCVPSPVAVAIGNVTLSNNQVARGVEVTIGSPAQSFAFLPQWPLNNTFVYGTSGFCDAGVSKAACTTFRGGAYSAIASSSRTVPDADTHPADASPWSSVSFSADTVELGSNTTTNSTPALAGFPFGIPLNDFGQQGYHPMNALGMGSNSTLLETLKASGRIASRTWSMFWGLDGADQTAQMDGVFVLGGYDSAKVVAAQKFTQPLAQPDSVCPTRMVVSITDMVLNFANGTNASIFPKAASNALAACIVPDYPVLMTLPEDPYFQTFQNLTNQTIEERSAGLAFFANRYPADGVVYTGDLTIKFETGLAIRIPNDQLIVPDRTISASGAIVANTTGPDTTILAIQNVNSNDMSQLGRFFLSAAYVMLNQDAGSFTLWQANPTTNRQLVAVDAANADVSATCSTAATARPASADPTASSTAPAAATTQPHHGALSSGATAGIAVAVVAAVAVAAALAWWLKRRRARPVASDEAAAAPRPSGTYALGTPVGPFDDKAAVSAAPWEAHELDGYANARAELGAADSRRTEYRKTAQFELPG